MDILACTGEENSKIFATLALNNLACLFRNAQVCLSAHELVDNCNELNYMVPYPSLKFCQTIAMHTGAISALVKMLTSRTEEGQRNFAGAAIDSQNILRTSLQMTPKIYRSTMWISCYCEHRCK